MGTTYDKLRQYTHRTLMLVFMWALCPKSLLHVMHVNAVKRKGDK